MLQSLVWLTIRVWSLVLQCLDKLRKKNTSSKEENGKLIHIYKVSHICPYIISSNTNKGKQICVTGLWLWVSVCTHMFFSILLGPLSCFEGFTVLGYYNGSMSQTDSGFPCLKWTEFPDYMLQYPDRGLGDHSYCRNPDRESQPWCFFRQRSGAIGWAYCNCHQGEALDVSKCCICSLMWVGFIFIFLGILKTILNQSCSRL